MDISVVTRFWLLWTALKSLPTTAPTTSNLLPNYMDLPIWCSLFKNWFAFVNIFFKSVAFHLLSSVFWRVKVFLLIIFLFWWSSVSFFFFTVHAFCVLFKKWLPKPRSKRLWKKTLFLLFTTLKTKCVNFPHQAILTLLPRVSAAPTGYRFSPTRVLPTSDTSRKSGPQVLLSEHLGRSTCIRQVTSALKCIR